MNAVEINNDHPAFADKGAAEAFRIISRLADSGFQAYLAGGCVRDALLGRRPKDFDVATNATPDSVREVFGHKYTLAFGASFGVIGVLPHKKSSDRDAHSQPTEVATFRSDGQYVDGRRPESVTFGSAEEDTKRRDFTINGLFYDPTQQQVIDFVGGQDDLQRQTIRTIGTADHRFDEDKLRMLRAIRFATVLGFEIESKTMNAIRKHADEIQMVSGERIGAEMRRVLASSRAAKGLELLKSSELAKTIFPDSASIDSDRCRSHLPMTESSVEARLACALLAGDLDDSVLATITHAWKLSNEERRRVHAAMKHWRSVVDAHKLPWSTVQPILIDRDASTIVEVAEVLSKARNLESAGTKIAREALQWEPEKLNPPPLLTGTDLQAAGITPGPHFKDMLQLARDLQLDGKVANADETLEIVKSKYPSQ